MEEGIMKVSQKKAFFGVPKTATWVISVLWLAAAPLAGFAQNTPEDWEVRVEGVRSDVLKSADMEAAKEHASHYVSMELESKGVVRTYQGIPLFQVAAMVDGTDSEHPYLFDADRWEAGYDITLVGSDGYAATFNTAETPHDAVIISVTVDGESTAPSIVGRISKGLWVKDLVAVELDLRLDGAFVDRERQGFRLVFDLAGEEHPFSLSELEASPYYIEEKGSYTTSAGTTITGVYGGVKFADMINGYMALKKSDTVTLVAMDGYEMSYSGEDILDESDGVWILAIKEDGDYMPKDPGFVRTIKVGPGVPDIPGHSSVRMIERVVVSGEPYRDFTLVMEGRMQVQVDRQTLQSGVSCHKRTVVFEWKDKVARYAGIPLWRMLAYSDDPELAPHKQDDSMLSYQKTEAERGYQVELIAADGFRIVLDSRELDGNDDVILAMYQEGEELPADEWPLILVWDREAAVVPQGAKPIKQIVSIRLVFQE